MRHIAWFLLAALSLIQAEAARRPRYGGVLRLKTRTAAASLDPGEAGDARLLLPLVFDRLVTLDRDGAPQPALAVGWTHDPDNRRWTFRLRPGVRFHDGALLAPGAAVAAALNASLKDIAVSAQGDALVLETAQPAPDLPMELAHRGFVFTRSAEGEPIGTGPFRLTRWEPGRRAVFTANEDYWDGRPFVESVEVEMGRGLREQFLDLELGRADVVELPAGEARRARRVWPSAPVELLALVFRDGRPADPRVREALALSVDRAAILNVLLQRQGEVAGGILPQWLSGYGFLFPTGTDLGRARMLITQTAVTARTLSLGYDAGDPLARLMAERIAVNARDSGILLQVAPQLAAPDARLARMRIRSLHPAQALEEFARALGWTEWRRMDAAEALYGSERNLLDGARIIPLLHVPALYGVSGRVRQWTEAPLTPLGEPRLTELWLEGGK